MTLEDARRLIQQYVNRYKNVRLHRAIGYVTPMDMLAGKKREIQSERDRKVGGGTETAADSPPAGRATDETDYFQLDDHTETTRWNDIPLWATCVDPLRQSEVTAYPEVETDARGGATVILPDSADYTLTESALFPFQAEPTHLPSPSLS